MCESSFILHFVTLNFKSHKTCLFVLFCVVFLFFYLFHFVILHISNSGSLFPTNSWIFFRWFVYNLVVFLPTFYFIFICWCFLFACLCFNLRWGLLSLNLNFKLVETYFAHPLKLPSHAESGWSIIDD